MEWPCVHQGYRGHAHIAHIRTLTGRKIKGRNKPDGVWWNWEIQLKPGRKTNSTKPAGSAMTRRLNVVQNGGNERPELKKPSCCFWSIVFDPSAGLKSAQSQFKQDLSCPILSSGEIFTMIRWLPGVQQGRAPSSWAAVEAPSRDSEQTDLGGALFIVFYRETMKNQPRLIHWSS